MATARRWAVRVTVAVGVLALGLFIALATMDRWLFVVLDPGPFDESATPPAPDYGDPGAWAARPDREDAADVALPELPAGDQTQAPAAVFYLHPTTSVSGDWNAPFDDPTIAEATARGGTLIQASVFNECCAVWAPRYRQANGRAFTHPDAEGERAIGVAYADVSAAFDTFLEEIGEQPFILAGHSQGAVLGGRLLRQRIAGSPLQARLVAAYLPGAPLRADTVGVPVCDRPDATGCVTSWHARGPKFTPNEFEFDAERADTMQGRICVNPLSWRTDGQPVAASENAGAVFFDTEQPALKPAFADARCVDGRLEITTMGDAERDLPSRVLLYVMGPDNYHPIEYQLFYADLRANASARVAAFVGGAAPP